jgi:PIN domain nuclease of toxin-antitoxin system
MLIAQAVTEKLTLITRDEQIRCHDVATITACFRWAVPTLRSA